MNKKTVLITGASSGIGKSASIYFSNKGWNVAATLRRPENEKELLNYSNVRLFKLDVTDENSIQICIEQVLKTFGNIDVVVNNAGYGIVGAFEAATKEQVQKQYDTNVFGVMNVTRCILPYFRERKSGTIINISSMGGRLTFPLYSLYHGTKWAIEGFSEGLQYELKQFNIRIKIVEPGAIKTDFYSRSQDLSHKEGLTDYDQYQKLIYPNIQKVGADAPGPEIVAKKIFEAASDSSFKLRYPVGSGAPFLLFLRWIIPLSWYFKIVRMVVERKH